MAAERLEKRTMFSNRELFALILPLVIEQFLAVAVGMADTAMVAGVGEAAVSAVSLVDSINTLLIQLFSAMATGGSIIAAQYLGHQDGKNACNSAKQLFLSILAISLAVGGAAVIFNRPILQGVFGSLDADTMSKARAYFFWSAVSYPFLALYNSGAGLMRAMGRTNSTMLVSLIMNVVNIIGNYFLINETHAVFGITVFGAGLGVSGAAIASLVARALAAFLMIQMLLDQSLPIHLSRPFKLTFDLAMVRRIMSIGVPNGMENSLFQVGKLIIARLISTFSTSVIAANSISNSISSLVNLPGTAIGLATVTVIGQCMGAGEQKQARYYARKLMTLLQIFTLPTNLTLLFFTPVFVNIFGLSAEGSAAAVSVLKGYAVCSILFYMLSFGLPNVLRAAGDVRFTMVVSIASILICRLALSYLFVYAFHWDLDGVWLAMYCDWVVRCICFILRYRSGKWQKHQLI